MATKDSWRDRIHARLVQLGSFQPGFDALKWTKDVSRELQGMSKINAGKHLLGSQILPRTDWVTVTTAFNTSPSALKKSKPSHFQSHRHPDTLATWNELHLEAKLKYISEKPFPSQKKGIFPDPTAEVKQLKTFLFYHLRTQIARDRDTEDDGDA